MFIWLKCKLFYSRKLSFTVSDFWARGTVAVTLDIERHQRIYSSTTDDSMFFDIKPIIIQIKNHSWTLWHVLSSVQGKGILSNSFGLRGDQEIPINKQSLTVLCQDHRKSSLSNKRLYFPKGIISHHSERRWYIRSWGAPCKWSLHLIHHPKTSEGEWQMAWCDVVTSMKFSAHRQWRLMTEVWVTVHKSRKRLSQKSYSCLL